MECFERAARHDPKMAQVRSRLAQEFSKCAKIKRAETLFRQSLGLFYKGWEGVNIALQVHNVFDER